jgi:DNA-binding XRE family transcriptional regulator
MVKVIDADLSRFERQADEISGAAQDVRDAMFKAIGALPDDRRAALDAQWEALLDRIEDIQAGMAYVRGRDDETFPSGLVERLLGGEPRLRVWREYRGLSVEALAEAAGVPPALVSDIEHGKEEGSIATLKALARALALDLDDLV